MASKVNIGVRDFSDEKSNLGFYIPEIDSGNFDTVVTQLQAVNVAVAAASLGNIVSFNMSIDTGLAGTDERPSNPFAQRELGIRLFMQDTVNGKTSTATIPCADLGIVGQGGTDQIDLTLSAMSGIKTALEAVIVSVDDNPVVINSARVVGRNS